MNEYKKGTKLTQILNHHLEPDWKRFVPKGSTIQIIGLKDNSYLVRNESESGLTSYDYEVSKSHIENPEYYKEIKMETNERISKDQYFMEMCYLIGKRGTCKRAKVGCVITKPNGYVVSTGYNSSPPGFPHCIDDDCLMKDGHCQLTTHSELAALLIAGERAKGCHLYCNYMPCSTCFKAALNSGIERIVYDKNYLPDEFKMWCDMAQKANPFLKIERYSIK